MKFMKLGSRPDTFYTTEAIRSVSSEVSSDLIIQVKGTRYLLHKFPLLSKSLRLQRMCYETPDSSTHQLVHLTEFPGGEDAFELCAKFCYGITITLSAYNIVVARCASEYLQMTEDVEKGNLVYKIEVFLNSCILQGWRDSIVTLKTTRAFPQWSEDLRITGRCIEAIASKVLTNPLKVSLSHSHSRHGGDNVTCNGAEIQSQRNYKWGPKGWWAEDIAELTINLYWRTMIAIKSSGRVPSILIGDALKVYASCWLPKVPRSRRTDTDIGTDSDSEDKVEITSKTRFLLESVISLLPDERGAVSCSFLLKLLKAANILGASPSLKMKLMRRVGIQLEEATAKDLLIPPPSRASEMLYDIDIVMNIVELFMLQAQSPPTSPPRFRPEFVEKRRSRSTNNINLEFQGSRRSSSASHGSKLKLARIIDEYLQEIGRDVNLPLSKFMALAEAIPDFARIDHDELYRAIDIYLKAHSDLTKGERKQLCRILDCKKLSMEACMHAAQNEMLPLRVVVQVLFFEQARVAKSGNKVPDLSGNIKALLESHGIDPSRPPAPLSTTADSVPADDQWSVSGIKAPKGIPTLKMKLAEDKELEDQDEMRQDGMGRSSKKLGGFCVIPGRPKRMFGKFWSNGRSADANNANEKN